MKNKNIIIIRNGNRDLITCMTFQDIIEFCIDNNINFVACNIIESEYAEMVSNIRRLNFVYKEHFAKGEAGYNSFRYMCAYDFDSETLKFVDNKNNKEEVYELDLNKGFAKQSSNVPFYKEFNSGRYGTGIKIYTTATTDEIIKYYSEHSIIKCILDKGHDNATNESLLKKNDKSELRQLIYSAY